MGILVNFFSSHKFHWSSKKKTRIHCSDLSNDGLWTYALVTKLNTAKNTEYFPGTGLQSVYACGINAY